MKTVLLIEGNGAAHRSLYSHKHLKYTDEKGFQHYTGMQYGVLSSLMYLNNEFDPEHMMIVWDSNSSRRINLFDGYKKKRIEKRNIEQKEIKKELKKNPKTLYHNFQKEAIETRKIISMIGIQQFRTPNEEADDVIATLVEKLKKNYNIIIISNDHDFIQLLDGSNVSIYKQAVNKKEIITYDFIKKKLGFKPKYYSNVLALGGDQSDEYPGVKGISPEKAEEIVRKYGPGLELILSKAKNNELEGRYNDLINSNIEMIKLCKKLSTLIKNVEIKELESEWDENGLKEIFNQLRFHSMKYDDKFNEVKRLRKEKIIIEP